MFVRESDKLVFSFLSPSLLSNPVLDTPGQEACLNILASKFDPATKTFPSDADLMAAVKASEIGQRADFKAVMKQCMPFLKFKQAEAVRIGPQVLESKLPFEEFTVLKENEELIKVRGWEVWGLKFLFWTPGYEF